DIPPGLLRAPGIEKKVELRVREGCDNRGPGKSLLCEHLTHPEDEDATSTDDGDDDSVSGRDHEEDDTASSTDDEGDDDSASSTPDGSNDD
ncbi:MAG TPA: hypothetical protein VFS75_00680, partial [Candidatus Paceibacterota bacterium]|nr:hypothetical protein [Candidatus Paceibacterota bacterium]